MKITSREVPMSMFKTRRAADSVASRTPVDDTDPDMIEGVSLDAFAAFTARIGQSGVTLEQHEAIAVELGFPVGRYDLIRNAWLSRVYASPAVGKRFGTCLDEARASL